MCIIVKVFGTPSDKERAQQMSGLKKPKATLQVRSKTTKKKNQKKKPIDDNKQWNPTNT